MYYLVLGTAGKVKIFFNLINIYNLGGVRGGFVDLFKIINNYTLEY